MPNPNFESISVPDYRPEERESETASLIHNFSDYHLFETVNSREVMSFNKTIVEDAIKEIINRFGERATDVIVGKFLNKELTAQAVILLLEQIQTDESADAFLKLVYSPDTTDNHLRAKRNESFQNITAESNKRVVPYIVKFADRTISILRSSLESSSETTDRFSNAEMEMRADDIGRALQALERFSDREITQDADKLYESLKDIKDQVVLARGKSQQVLAPFMNEDIEVSAENYEKLSLADEREIKGRIFGYSIFGDNVPRGLSEIISNKGEGGAILIFQGYQAGYLSVYQAIDLLEKTGCQREKLDSMYEWIIFDETLGGDGAYNSFRVLEKLSDTSRSLRIGAEFTRRSAEFLYRLSSDNEDDILRHTRRLEDGIKFLETRGGENLALTFEVIEYLNKIRFAYPQATAGYDALTKINKIEKPSDAEKKKWSHNKMYIRGSALFAEMLGKGKEKVRDLDIFVTENIYGNSEPMKVASAESIEEIKYLLSDEEYQRLRDWVVTHGYEGKKINLVKVPHHHLDQEATFLYEPRLLLWEKDRPAEVNFNSSSDHGTLEQYNAGELIVNSEFQHRLVPNGTLARALRLIDLGERFGFEIDTSLLEQAEQSARNRKLAISSNYVNGDNRIGGELNGIPVIDPAFIKVFQDKNLRKPLLRRFPRIGQIAEEIIKDGGVKSWIEKRYGKVYLDTMGYVRLYDINLSKSAASIEAQQDFISEWYARINQESLTFTGVQKMSDEVHLPEPGKIFEDLIDKKRLANAESQRAEKSKILDTLVGTYRVRVEGSGSVELKNKINSFLKTLNLEWPKNVEPDKVKVTQTLIKLGVDPKNPILEQFDTTKAHDIEIVISGDSIDILQASTKKPWTSCVNLEAGSYRIGLYDDVSGGSVISYVMKGNNFIARNIIRAGVDLNNLQPAAAIEKTYGDRRYDELAKKALAEIIKGAKILIGTPMMTFPMKNAYADSASIKTDSGNLLYNAGLQETNGGMGGMDDDPYDPYYDNDY